MKKGIWVAVMMLCALAAATGAVDPEVRSARAKNGTAQPSLCVTDVQMKTIFATGDLLNSTERNLIAADDGYRYNMAGSGGYRYWDWIMVLFTVDEVEGSYTVSWEGYTDARDDYAMKAYAWDWTSELFALKDGTAPTGIWNTARTFTIGLKYWSYDPEIDKYQCLILVEGRVEDYLKGMHIDVVRQDF